MLNPELKSLYDKYRLELKPLIAEYESRNENFVAHLLHDIPFMFDNIALFEVSSSGKDVYIADAEKRLDQAIYNVRFCLVGSMMMDVKRFKSRFSKASLELFDSGKFYARFIQLENEVRSIKNIAFKHSYGKISGEDLKQAYDKLKKMEDLIAQYHDGALVNGLMKDNTVVTICKWVFSIAIALLFNYLIQKLS